MEVDTVEFDGSILNITYRKAAKPLGWWCGQTTHAFEWLPDVNSLADVTWHYSEWLGEHHKKPLSVAQREQLQLNARVSQAGQGVAVYLSPEFIEWHVAGGKNWIYLISASDTHGALRIPDSSYQSYALDQFDVLDET